MNRYVMEAFLRAGRLGLAAAALAAAVLLTKRPRDRTVSMNELDWRTGEVDAGPRRYRSFRHAGHHARELVSLAAPIFRIHALRALEPSLREQVMVVTAAANRCSP